MDFWPLGIAEARRIVSISYLTLIYANLNLASCATCQVTGLRVQTININLRITS